MQVTKFTHSCLLVETPERTALFDPGVMSEASLDVGAINRLDDIFITHIHPDHLSMDLLKQLVIKFPSVRITATKEIVEQLGKEGITASAEAPTGVKFFNAPHEPVAPMFNLPQEIGVHYLETVSHPGDSHSFTETMPVLALPITAPWGSSVKALNLAIELKPQYVLPIHDWHWRDEARSQTYDMFEKQLAEHNITFLKLEDGQPQTIDLAI